MLLLKLLLVPSVFFSVHNVMLIYTLKLHLNLGVNGILFYVYGCVNVTNFIKIAY